MSHRAFRLASLLVVPACVTAGEGGPDDLPPAPHYEQVGAPASSDEIYDPLNLPRFDLEIDEAGIESLRSNPREEVPATFRYRDLVVQGVGVRLKGEYSFRPIDEKPSFRLDFDELVKGQRFLGLERMVLNNTVQDPTFLSERFAYRLYRQAGLPAPRANSALVFVNGSYFGLYTNVEAIDEIFLARWFADTGGNLYEDGGADFVPGAETSFDLETNEALDDRTDLAGLVAALDRATPDDFVEQLGPHLDLDRFVRYAALEAAIGQQDGYAFGSGDPNNFRLYNHPATGTFTFIPSGMDRTLRPANTPALFHEWVPPVPTYGSPWEITGLLLEKCVASPQCRAAYAAALMDSAALIEASDLGGEMERAEQQIRAAVMADRRKELDDRYFDYALRTMRDYVAGRAAALRAEVERGE
jgi:hypothetical protein